jgi:hypothetical protein
MMGWQPRKMVSVDRAGIVERWKLERRLREFCNVEGV